MTAIATLWDGLVLALGLSLSLHGLLLMWKFPDWLERLSSAKIPDFLQVTVRSARPPKVPDQQPKPVLVKAITDAAKPVKPLTNYLVTFSFCGKY